MSDTGVGIPNDTVLAHGKHRFTLTFEILDGSLNVLGFATDKFGAGCQLT